MAPQDTLMAPSPQLVACELQVVLQRHVSSQKTFRASSVGLGFSTLSTITARAFNGDSRPSSLFVHTYHHLELVSVTTILDVAAIFFAQPNMALFLARAM